LPRIPLTLLTGFLGSGKSTLLTQILADKRFGDTAVVVNEFGEIGIDGFLVEHRAEQMVIMTTGCLCCTIRGDIRETLLDLDARRAAGEIPAFSRVVVETTGIADPAPVIHTLMMEPELERRFGLGGVVATIDAINGGPTIETHPECAKQIAVADRLVLTKHDLIDANADPDDFLRLMSTIRRLNPGAPLFDRHEEGFDLKGLFDAGLYDLATKSADVGQWLSAEAVGDEVHHHHHDVNRHGEEIRTFTVVFDEPLRGSSFLVAMEYLTANFGPDLLRIKGLVNLREEPGRPIAVHGVQHLLHEMVWLDSWPDLDHRTKLVFITRNISRETIDAFLANWVDSVESRTAAMLGSL